MVCATRPISKPCGGSEGSWHWQMMVNIALHAFCGLCVGGTCRRWMALCSESFHSAECGTKWNQPEPSPGPSQSVVVCMILRMWNPAVPSQSFLICVILRKWSQVGPSPSVAMRIILRMWKHCGTKPKCCNAHGSAIVEPSGTNLEPSQSLVIRMILRLWAHVEPTLNQAKVL